MKMQVKKLNVSKREHTPLRLLQEQYIFSKNPLGTLVSYFFQHLTLSTDIKSLTKGYRFNLPSYSN